MTTNATTTGTAATVKDDCVPGRTLRFGHRQIGVVGPSLGDPRLRLSAVVVALQILGQTVLGFKVSIAQIIITVATCAVFETAVTLHRRQMLVWPASGLLTGNSVAFILRASGTRHGDWWSLHGIQYFVLAAAISLLSKYLIRPAGRHLFNPSNLGIVSTLLLVGPVRVFPQYLWWGPLRGPVLAALGVIVLGGFWVLKPVRMYAMALAFLTTLGAIVGVFAATGRSFVAIWHDGPVLGMSYWLAICASPEVLVFVFFMMSDPQTAPHRRNARILYGALTAGVATILLYFQPTEFGIKLAVLSSLTLTCALSPFLDKGLARASSECRAPWMRALRDRLRIAILSPVVVVASIIAVAAPVDTAALAGNKQIILIERGLTGSHNPQ